MSPLDVVFFTNDFSDTSIPAEIANGLVDRGVDVEVCAFFSVEVQSFDVPVHSIEADSQFALAPYRRLYAYLTERSPDVLHVHPNATGAIARVVGTLLGVPVVVTSEHSTHERFSPVKNLVNGGTNWLNDAVVANSEATARSFGRWERALLDAAGAETTVIHNGVDVERIQDNRARPPVNLPEGPIVGTVGRLAPVKNQERLLRAAAPLVEPGSAALVIVGNGPEREALEATADRLGMSDGVHFLGRCTRDEVYATLRAMDVFAFPSLAEGFGVAVLEAMAAGVPPVVSDIPAMREVVGDAGRYVDPTDVEALRRALRTLLADPDERREVGRRSRERALSEFPLSRTVDEHLALYERLLARKGRAPHQ